MVTSTELQAVAGLLIGGFAIFLVGAALWRMEYETELPEALLAIAESSGRWRWIHAWMIAGVAVTIVGLTALTLVMAASDEPVYGAAGGALFAIGGKSVACGRVLANDMAASSGCGDRRDGIRAGWYRRLD